MPQRAVYNSVGKCCMGIDPCAGSSCLNRSISILSILHTFDSKARLLLQIWFGTCSSKAKHMLLRTSVFVHRSLEPFLASVAYSGFDRLVTVLRQPAGAADGQPACLERSGVSDTAVARGYSTAEV